MENEYEIKTGIELDGKFYELTQKYREISAEKYYSLYCKLKQFDDSKQERRMSSEKQYRKRYTSFRKLCRNDT